MNISRDAIYEDTVLICPYYNQPLCKEGNDPVKYIDCDACKSHWLMEKYEG